MNLIGPEGLDPRIHPRTHFFALVPIQTSANHADFYSQLQGQVWDQKRIRGTQFSRVMLNSWATLLVQKLLEYRAVLIICAMKIFLTFCSCVSAIAAVMLSTAMPPPPWKTSRCSSPSALALRALSSPSTAASSRSCFSGCFESALAPRYQPLPWDTCG